MIQLYIKYTFINILTYIYTFINIYKLIYTIESLCYTAEINTIVNVYIAWASVVALWAQ